MARVPNVRWLRKWNDAADFGRVLTFPAKKFELRIDHFNASGAQAIDFGFAVKHQELAGFQAAFEIAAMKNLQGSEPVSSWTRR